MSGVSVKLPLVIDDVDGVYKLNKTLEDTIQQNLKNLILTSPGERMMDPDFGVGIMAFLHEPNTTITHSALSARIHSQVNKYMPFIEVTDVAIGPDDAVFDSINRENAFGLRIKYLILPLSQDEVLNITVPESDTFL